MLNDYPGVTTRFLRHDERLIVSEENEMPLVIEASTTTSLSFLHDLLATHSAKILEQVSTYGAVLLRGFDVASEKDFETTILMIQGLQGISEAFMSENGRTHVDGLDYILHTNAIYKTGGTLYLGGFHTENYYSADVPSTICFCCLKPSRIGGETGLINMEKVYQCLDPLLQKKLEKEPFFVAKWRVSEVAERYGISTESVEKIAKRFDLPLIGEGESQFILMYKPSVLEDSVTQKKALQINLFEIASLNVALRKCFMKDYQGKTWFWHRFVWRLPAFIFKTIEFFYIIVASFFYSPKGAFQTLRSKWKTYRAEKKSAQCALLNNARVGHCFTKEDVNALAQLLKKNYSSCLWKNGDILIVNNQKVAHAGMPGSGPRLVRAMICNPLEMNYSVNAPGLIPCKNREGESVGHFFANNEGA